MEDIFASDPGIKFCILILIVERKDHGAIELVGTDRPMNNLIPKVSADVTNTLASI